MLWKWPPWHQWQQAAKILVNLTASKTTGSCKTITLRTQLSHLNTTLTWWGRDIWPWNYRMTDKIFIEVTISVAVNNKNFVKMKWLFISMNNINPQKTPNNISMVVSAFLCPTFICPTSKCACKTMMEIFPEEKAHWSEVKAFWSVCGVIAGHRGTPETGQIVDWFTVLTWWYNDCQWGMRHGL